jgi:hypothetical protein
MAKKKHPLVDLFGDGILTGLFLYGLFRFVIRPIGKGISHLAWRWRRVLTPLYLATGTEILALVWRGTASWTWWAALVLPAAGLVLAVLGPRLSGPWSRLVLALVPDSVDAGRKGVLDRVPERTYLALFLAALGGWLALRVGAGPSTTTALWWQLGLLVFGGSWWYHRRIRVAGRADRYARRWRILADKERGPIRELHGSRVVEARGSRGQSILTIRLAEGMTAAQLAPRMDTLASFYSLRLSSIYLLTDESNARRVSLRFLPKDPWKGKILHPMPAPGTVSLRANDLRFSMGLHADAMEEIYMLQHTLVVGANGSGKSIWLESLLVYLAACDDCMLAAGDLASGATLRVWEPVMCMPVATDYESTVVLFERVMAFIEDRERRLGLDKASSDDAPDAFMPSPSEPWLTVIVDEYPDFVAEAEGRGKEGQKHLALVGRCGKRGRKAGVRFILLCQNGSKADTGSKELQAQLKSTVGLALDAHASRVLWGDLVRYGWNSAGLKTGQHLLRDEAHSTPNIAKGYFVTVRDRRAHIEACVAAGRPTAEPTAWAALMGHGGIIIDMPDEDAEPDEVMAALDIEPGKADELAERTGLSRATVFRRLNRLAGEGRAHSRSGVWHTGAAADVDVSA